MSRWDGNISLSEYLLKERGPQHLPLSVVLPITIIYSIIFFTGIIGNVLVCVVIAKNKALHNVTNYYLFSLAVSDLTLLLLGLPNDLSVYWKQYPWELGLEMCKVRALVSEMTSYTSVLTIVAFSMERYIAICHPLYSYKISTFNRAIITIIFVWSISFVCALPFAMFSTVNYVEFPPRSGNKVAESAFCAMLDENVPPFLPIYELSSLLFFVFPMIILTVLYAQIAKALRKRNRNAFGGGGEVHEGSMRRMKSRRSIIHMLIAVVVAFFLCWAPFHAQRLIYLYARNVKYFREINDWIYYITGCFYFFSSTVNPVLYNLMSEKYRTAFKQTLCGIRDRNSVESSSFKDASGTVLLQSMKRRSAIRATQSFQRSEPQIAASTQIEPQSVTEPLVPLSNEPRTEERLIESNHSTTCNDKTYLENEKRA